MIAIFHFLFRRRRIGLAAAIAATSLMAGCAGLDIEEAERPTDAGREQPAEGKIFGKDGLLIFGRQDDSGAPGGGGIGVNSFLWRASLDTLSFMPLSSADPFGGVIITDWYAPPESRLERFKMTVYILDRRLRADALKVAVFRQARPSPNGEWSDAKVAVTTPTEVENAILTKARHLRLNNVE